MFRKVLVANRGEIALRVIRTCKEMGISTVAVYSSADAEALHVQLADERICIGPADPALSYRNVPNLLSAAEITDAEAIHPGYGFLSENAQFAEACEAAGITFIGPPAEVIAKMGDKAKARELMRAHGLTVMPGSVGLVASEEAAVEVARGIGFPVIIKAAAGGGGRGLRVVNREEDLAKAWQLAETEAKNVFGDDGLYIEKYFLEPRHIEIQILADHRGRVIHLGERDCSIQRRHQKLIEEAPSPAVDDRLRHEIGQAAIEIAKAAGYRNAGTVEFLLDKGYRFYFMEMNTRIQVEHPVTEMVTGVDIVREQLRIAAGEPLGLRQQDVRIRGHSIECRINAECPDTFTPSAGMVTRYIAPGGLRVRVDSAVHQGSLISPYYDSMVAKIIVHGDTRDEAIGRMRRALDEFTVEGVKTTIPLYKRILLDPSYQKGRFSTSFIERFLSPSE